MLDTADQTKAQVKKRYLRLHTDSIGLFLTTPTEARLVIAVDMLDYQRRLGCMDVEMQRMLVDALELYHTNPTGANVATIIVLLNQQKALSCEC